MKDYITIAIQVLILIAMGLILYTTYNTNKIVTEIQADYEFYID